jgi:phosphoenolpyruvate synthase/pyruvate phosphate dikinase
MKDLLGGKGAGLAEIIMIYQTVMRPSAAVYFFGSGKAEGNGKMKDLLGGKGGGLAEMTKTKYQEVQHERQ